jgi:hypothetical protein
MRCSRLLVAQHIEQAVLQAPTAIMAERAGGVDRPIELLWLFGGLSM